MTQHYPHLAPMYPHGGRPMKCSTCPVLAICKETVKPPLAWMLCEAPTDDDVARWVREGLWWNVKEIRDAVTSERNKNERATDPI